MERKEHYSGLKFVELIQIRASTLAFTAVKNLLPIQWKMIGPQIIHSVKKAKEVIKIDRKRVTYDCFLEKKNIKVNKLMIKV